MGKLLINEATGKTLVLLDTCSYENIAKGVKTDVTISAISSILQPNHMGVISDLSLAELIEGRKTLEEYNSFRNTFLELGFGVFGHSNILSLIGSDALNNSFETEQEYQLFRGRIIDLKRETIKPIFKDILLKYTILFVSVLAECDNEYFSHFPHLVVGLLSKQLDDMDDFWSYVFSLIPSFDKKEQKDILYSTCAMLLEALAQTKNPNYVENEVTIRLESMGFAERISAYSSKAIKTFKKRDCYKQLRKMNNIDFLMNLLALNKSFKLNEDKIEFDGTSFAAVNSGFCQGKFQMNDLVDIYNVSFIANAQEEFEYYTEENRWKEFVSIEKKNGRI